MITHGKETTSAAAEKRQVQEPPLTGGLLSERERAVLAALGRGFSTKEIAAQLGIDDATVRAFVARIVLKLRVPDRDAAVKRARRLGVL